MAKSLNKVMLIGNLTRDPELKHTANNNAVCSFGIATNRDWLTKDGEKQSDVEFHNITAWGKLAEICGQYLKKGSKVYVEGRLQTRKWEGADKVERKSTDVVIDNMIMMNSLSEQSGSTESYTSPQKVSKQTAAEESFDADDVSDDVPF
jgi:single-strand DNA-binding protein